MWADRLREQAVAVHAMHPGWPDTPGVRRSLPAGLPPGRRCGRRSSLASIWRVDAGQVDGADVSGWMARPLIDQIFLFCAVLCGVGRAARRLLPSPAEFGKCGVIRIRAVGFPGLLIAPSPNWSRSRSCTKTVTTTS